MIISKTPYRISFFGGGSDYPEWYNEFGGTVLSTTINKYLYIKIFCLHVKLNLWNFLIVVKLSLILKIMLLIINIGRGYNSFFEGVI